MTSMTLKLCSALAGAALAAAQPAAAQTTVQQTTVQMQQQIQSLQQQIQTLQTQVNDTQSQQRQLQQMQSSGQSQPPQDVGMARMTPGNRPGICSADGANCIYLTGRLHFDAGDYLSVHPQQKTGPHSLTSGVNARRARLGVLGVFDNDWNYAFIIDVGGSTDATPTGTLIENAYISYNGFRPYVAIDLGYLDVPFTLDESTSSNDIMFIERAEAKNVASNLAADDARAALGVRSNNDRYFAGVYVTGPQAGATHTGTNSQQIGGTARFTYQALQGQNYSLHVGLDGEYVFLPRANGAAAAATTSTVTFSDRPELRVDSTAFLNTGQIPAHSAAVFGGELAGGYDSFFFQGEYYIFQIDQSGLSKTSPTPELTFDGGYAEASWTVTGESRRYIPSTGAYSGIIPAHPFSLKDGGWGALELAVRYSYLNLNDHAHPGVSPLVTGGVFGGRATGLTFGVNWYVNRNMRFMLDYIHEDVNKIPQATAGGTTSGGVQINAIALRTQVAF
jgi:phosphate-selective porin OprO and OprP